MQWALITLAGALSFSGVSALIDSAIDTKVIAHPRAHLYGTGNIVNTVAQQFEERNATTPNLDSRSSHHLLPRQAAGRCGAEFSNQRCGGNQCCSSYGYCGSEFEVRIFVQDLDVLHADMGYLSTVASLSDVSLTLEGVVMQHQGQPLRQRQLPRLCRQQAQSLSLQARRLYRRCPPAL